MSSNKTIDIFEFVNYAVFRHYSLITAPPHLLFYIGSLVCLDVLKIYYMYSFIVYHFYLIVEFVRKKRIYFMLLVINLLVHASDILIAHMLNLYITSSICNIFFFRVLWLKSEYSSKELNKTLKSDNSTSLYMLLCLWECPSTLNEHEWSP